MAIKIPFSTKYNSNESITTVIRELDPELKNYTVNFTGVPYDYYVRGINANDAIANARDEATNERHSESLGTARARLTVYGEWDCEPKHYHNDGTHSHAYN